MKKASCTHYLNKRCTSCETSTPSAGKCRHMLHEASYNAGFAQVQHTIIHSNLPKNAAQSAHQNFSEALENIFGVCDGCLSWPDVMTPPTLHGVKVKLQ